MRLNKNLSYFVANKIVIDLINAPFVKLLKERSVLVEAIKKIIDKNIDEEKELDSKVKEMMAEHYEDIELQHADERQLFFMIKKRLAPEFGIIMNYDDRYSDYAHQILDELYEEYLIEYEVNDNQVKNVIFKAFKDFIAGYEEIDDIVYEKIKRMQEELIPGSEQYELTYDRLFKEELSKRGML